jgi:hypothetical protein
MKVAGYPEYQTDLKNLTFAKVAKAVGFPGIRSESALYNRVNESARIASRKSVSAKTPRAMGGRRCQYDQRLDGVECRHK